MINASDLANKPEYIKMVNGEITRLKEIFERVKELLFLPLSDDNYNKAFQAFYLIIDIIPLMVNKLPAMQIVRGRPRRQKDELCTNKSDLSYNWKYRKDIKLGRFNQQGEAVFYASMPTESKAVDYILTCALECCKELTTEYGVDLQEITLGGWIIDTPVDVVNLCFDDLHLTGNPDLKEAVESYLRAIRANFSTEAANFIEEFLRYISELSRTTMGNNECYKLTSPFFCAVRYYYDIQLKQPVYGLLYPSAMTLAKGLNIVLTKDAVDNFIQLDKVVIYRSILLKPERKTYKIDKCSDIIKVVGNEFSITGYTYPHD